MTASYNAGELVYWPEGAGAQVYMSLVNNNSSPPTVEAWSSIPEFSLTTTYALDAVVRLVDVLYVSLQASNLGNAVASSPLFWRLLPPDLTLGSWLLLDAELAPINNPAALYPQQFVFPLPNNYLRTAPQEPKAGSYSALGSPTNAQYNDWLYEGPWIISRTGAPAIVFRFAADIADVKQFDPMFVEGFAARMAMEICEPITQSTEKLMGIEKGYNKLMGEARLVNAVEVGSQEAPLDDYLSSRY